MGKKIKLPKTIKYDLKGYRGYFEVDFQLEFKHYDDGKVGGFYLHHGAEYGLYAEICDSEDEVRERLANCLKRDGYID